MLNIHTIPALIDNYIWLIEDTESKQCLIIDPGDAKPVLTAIKQADLCPLAILITHHHPDHTAGIDMILSHYPIPVYGKDTDRIPSITHPITDQVELSFQPYFPSISILDIPGHTQIHSAFLINDMLFSGDTIFGAGCGRLLGGTAEQLFSSLKLIQTLPDNTKIYCSHEYTEVNLQFAHSVEPTNNDIIGRIQTTKQIRQKKVASVPFTLKTEQATNPFLRCDLVTVRQQVEQYSQQDLCSPLEVFTALRKWKDQF